MARPQIVSLSEAIAQIKDGDMLTFGGFTVWRRPMAAIYELIRQKKETCIWWRQMAEPMMICWWEQAV